MLEGWRERWGGSRECWRYFSHHNAGFKGESPSLSSRVSGSLLGLVRMPQWRTPKLATVLCWCWELRCMNSGAPGGVLLGGSVGKGSPDVVRWAYLLRMGLSVRDRDLKQWWLKKWEFVSLPSQILEPGSPGL